jgi:hypothetical protein
MSFSEGITFEDGIDEDALPCANCREAMPYGEEVEFRGWFYCGPCAHEEREAMREEQTDVGPGPWAAGQEG